jgi:hypothetical protein
VITYCAPEYQVTFFQDETAGIFVWMEQPDLKVTVGSLVEVDGNTTPGDFAPSIEHARVRVLGHAVLPAPSRKSLQDLLTGNEDSQWTEVQETASHYTRSSNRTTKVSDHASVSPAHRS